MAVGLRLWLCFLFGFAIICSAQNTISLSGDEVAVVLEEAAMEGRSLRVELDDYGEASANRGHDPRNKLGGGNNGGRKSHDIP